MDPVSEKKKAKSPPVLQILTGKHKGKQFRLLAPKIVLGRHSDCDVVFKDNPNCSRYHAKIIHTEGYYKIESLNADNPVLINKEPVSSHIFQSKDRISIGNIEMLFLDQAPVSSSFKPSGKVLKKSQNKKKNFLNPPRLLLLFVLLAGAYLYTSEDSKQPEEKMDLQTESKMLEEIEQLQKLNEESAQKAELSPKEKSAREAFLKGFRDYRKGYFQRALKIFQHCLTLNKQEILCQSYAYKSRRQIDKLIQKKIRLGKSYKDNQQYKACRAAFKSVEIMIQDSKSLLYKEARENRKDCEIQLKNKI